MDYNLKNKIALITGAAHGQGRATALVLAREGVHIAAIDIAKPQSYPGYEMGNPRELKDLESECEQLGVRCLPIIADVTNDNEISSAIATVVNEFHGIDILFNNAGICAFGFAHELSEKEWDQMIDINLKGPWIVCRYVIPHMIKAKSGVIINNSSVAGLRGMNRLSHYAASKWGLTGFSKSLAIELAPYNIRVVSIHPTGVNTPMNDGLAQIEGMTPKEMGEASAGNLLSIPWIEPEDVAEAIVFLASDKARYITGSEFIIDAGLTTK